MALATCSDALPTHLQQPGPATAEPGLAARMSSLDSALALLVADLDPGLLVGADAVALFSSFCRLERLVVGAKALLAPRIAASGIWGDQGFRSAAGLLASLEGGSVGQARRTLESGQSLVDLPGTEEAVRDGRLSGPKLVAITRAATLDPDAEGLLLAGSDDEPLQVVNQRCQKVRTQAAGNDPRASEARIHAARTFASWTDVDGAFCYSGRDTAERGARLLARLAPVANRLRHDRRAAAAEATSGGSGRSGRAGRHGGPSPAPESEGALRADALFALVCGGRGGRGGRQGPGSSGSSGSSGGSDGSGGSGGPDGPHGSSGSDSSGGSARSRRSTSSDRTAGGDSDPDTTGLLADPDELGSADDLVSAAPPATVIVRVDLAALRRGRALPGELCEVDGAGTVPVPVVTSLIDDSFLACVFTEAGDIRAVSHLGRTINAHLRTALVFRDRCCVVPGCGASYSLEIDHVHPLELGGRTELDNLALLCRHHHRLKTYEGWTLERTGPTDEDPGWVFTPLPPFGQEPDLGLDRPDDRDRPEAVPRT